MTPLDTPQPEAVDARSAPDPPRLAHRRFVGRDEPLLRLAARRLVSEASEGDGRWIDLRGVLVALPGARAGRRLGELLLERAEERGRGLLPPEITTVGDLPERFYVRELPEPDAVLDGAAWRAALEGLAAAETALLTAHPPAADDDAGWSRIAQTLRKLHREVAAGGWTFHQVAETCAGDGLLFDDGDRWRLLAIIQERYRAILARHGRRDREEARRRALAGGAARIGRPLWLVGVSDLPPVVRRFLREAERLAAHTVLIPASDSEAEGFDELGGVVAAWWEGRDPAVRDEAVRVVGGPAEQAAAVVDALAGLDGRYAAEEIGVGVPDPHVLPFLLDALEAAGVPVRWAGGRPVHRTELYRLLEALAGFLERREYDAFASLVRHPAVDRALRRSAGVRQVESIPALLDRFHAQHLPARLERGRLPTGGERPGAPLQTSLTRIRDALGRLLAPLEGSRPLAEWPAGVQAVVVALLGDPTLDRGRDEHRDTIHVATALRDVLQSMQSLPAALDRPVTADRAIRTVLAELRDRAVPEEAELGAVELTGWLELALDDAPVVVVTGVNEPHLPEAVTGHLFLPHSLRSRLGLLDNRERWARDLLHLKMVLEGRDRTLLLAGRRDADGNPLRLSRLLVSGPLEEVAHRVLSFLDGGGSAAPAEEAAARPATEAQAAPGDDGAFHLPPERVLSAPAVPEQIRVTQFRRLLEDPFLYALEDVLGLDVVDDRAREMDGALFGTLAHAVLERWGRLDSRDSVDPAELRTALEHALDELARERFGSRPLPAVRLQIEQLRSRLGAFASWQAAWRDAGWEIRDVEAAPEAPGVPFDVDGSPVRLRGRIDRVDHHPETGRWLLLDYKTGDKVRDPERSHRKGRGQGRRWVDLQLPLYRRLAPALRDREGAPLIPREDLRSLEVGYVALPRERKLVCERLADWSPDELADAEETARAAVRLLRLNRFRFRPGETRARRGSALGPLLGMGVMTTGRRGATDIGRDVDR